MAAARPPLPRSSSYQVSYQQREKSLRPQKVDLRSRSHSRNRPAKLYNAEAPKWYMCNESRARKPPPSPTIEDQGFGPEEVMMRGKPDQTPMLIQVAGDSSSTESNGPLTPESSLSDGQEAYAHFSEDDSGHETEPTASPEEKRRLDLRGRRQGYKLEAQPGRSSSIEASPPQRIERARSPYSFRPPRLPKPEDKRQPAVQLLTPEPTSPQVAARRRRFEPQGGHVPARPLGGTTSIYPSHPPTGANGGHVAASDGLKRPARPILERRASAMPQLGNPTSATAARSRYVENSSDESDREYAKLRARSGQLTSDALPTNSASYFSTPRQSERHSIRNSPPRTPLSPELTRGTFFNKDSLLNGPALQHLSTVLEGQQSNPRQASPRPSPQNSPRVSPTTTPYPSPPRTPPERHHRRSNTVEILQQSSSATTKISSPLSSRPSSPNPGVQTFTAQQLNHDVRPPPMMSKERRTSTWDSSSSSVSSQQDSTHGSKVDIRSTSPEVRKQDRKASYDDYDSRGHRTRQPSYTPDSPKKTTMLEPFEPNRRHRRPSSEDLRQALPQLVTKQPLLHQDLDSPKIQRSKNRSGSYIPATAGASLGAELLSATSQSHRSQSIAPESSLHRRHRSRSRTVSDVKPEQRSRSSAPKQSIPFSDRRQPVLLPQCPRPEPVAGYSDWYSLDRNPSMMICPECRESDFGTGWERAFRRATEPDRRQKILCSMNDPWVRLACLDSFQRQHADIKLLDLLAEVSQEEKPCPESRLHEDRTWYHLRDSETDRDFKDFHICAHCVCSLETIYPRLWPMFHRSKDLKKDEPRVCSLRSDVHRFGKYLNSLVNMAQEAKSLPKDVAPPTSDFIWEVKWMTIISPCNGAAVHYGQDMHSHPKLPQLTICEECYYKTVRPLIKSTHRDSGHFIHGIPPDAQEIVGGSTCKLYSPRMKQIFETSVKDRDFDYLSKAVKKRNDLLMDLEEAKMVLAKKPLDEKAKEEVEYLKGKWEKLERSH